jgi:polyisoprenoid-binding protein YceI
MKRFLSSVLSSSLLGLAVAVAPYAAADTYSIDKGHSAAEFQVRHMVTKVRGRFGDFAGTIQVDPKNAETSSVEFTIQSASVSSDNVDKYPTITFKSSKIRKLSEDHFEVTGILEMRGTRKEITLPVTFLGIAKTPWGGEVAGFETQVTLNRKDFGIVWNKSLDNGGVLVGDDAVVTINIEAKKVEPKPAAGK